MECKESPGTQGKLCIWYQEAEREGYCPEPAPSHPWLSLPQVLCADSTYNRGLVSAGAHPLCGFTYDLCRDSLVHTSGLDIYLAVRSAWHLEI